MAIHVANGSKEEKLSPKEKRIIKKIVENILEEISTNSNNLIAKWMILLAHFVGGSPRFSVAGCK